jgi:hypothetical protein
MESDDGFDRAMLLDKLVESSSETRSAIGIALITAASMHKLTHCSTRR